MKIEVELSDDERDLLCFLLGAGTAMLMSEFGRNTGLRCVALMNKLYALEPDFIPYDSTKLKDGLPFGHRPVQ